MRFAALLTGWLAVHALIEGLQIHLLSVHGQTSHAHRHAGAWVIFRFVGPNLGLYTLAGDLQPPPF